MLKDSFGRSHDYLRVSLTDHCNFRCTYCTPEDKPCLLPDERFMRPDELDEIVGTFVRLGVRKVRLTGGEPLMQRSAAQTMKALSRYPVTLTITTNGFLAHRFLATFKETGIQSLNVSLDSMNPAVFYRITKTDGWKRVWDNIHLLIKHGFHVKINMVVMRGINDSEVCDFVELTRHCPLHVRFIEFMPFQGNRWHPDAFIKGSQIRERIERRYELKKLDDGAHDTAKNYKVPHFRGSIAFINTMSEPFCGMCNRMRLTADGKMKNCLFSGQEVDILGALRNGKDISKMIAACVEMKEKERGGCFRAGGGTAVRTIFEGRAMVSIGG